MASSIFLIRKNLQWARYDDVTDITLGGLSTRYTSVTGVAATDVITVTGSAPSDWQTVIFKDLSGGSGLTSGTVYYVRDSSGSTFKVAATIGGAAIDFTTTITDGEAWITTDEMRVWSAEYRDIFNSSVANTESTSTVHWANLYRGELDAAADIEASDANSVVFRQSDEVMHRALRQTFLAKTHWRFDRGADIAPRYLYAEWASGDIIADNAPETNPA